jgi:Arc/MetJ-type ribon-helix-helix transcriptional regulator
MTTTDAMSTGQQIRITLPRATVEAVRAKVASGEYATESDVAPRRSAASAEQGKRSRRLAPHGRGGGL